MDVLTAFALCAWFSSFASPLIAVAVWIGGISVAALTTVTGWRLRYRAEPVFAAITALRSDLARVTKERNEANGVFEELKAKRLRRRASFTEDGSRLQKREGALRADEEARLREIDARLQDGLHKITNRMRSAAADEGAEKRKLVETVGGGFPNCRARYLPCLIKSVRNWPVSTQTLVPASIRLRLSSSRLPPAAMENFGPL